MTQQLHLSDTLPIQGTSVLIIGNRSYKNLGDELILLGTIKLLLKEKKRIYVAAYDTKRIKDFLKQFIDISQIQFITELPKGLRSFFRFFFSQRIKDISYYFKSDSIIVGGGEILTEENPNSYRYRLLSLWPCLIKQIFTTVPIYLMGGIQIPRGFFNKLLFRFFLRRTIHAYVRDQDSVDGLTAFGYKKASFFMDTAYYAYDWKGIKKEPTEKKYVIINLNKHGEHFLEQMHKDIEDYSKKGYLFYFVAMSKGRGEEYSDITYYRHLKNKFPELTIKLLDREIMFPKFVSLLKNAEFVITSRLHLFLLASFLKVPTKVYPYQKKIVKMQQTIKQIFSL